ncbi:DUF1176 domain-containing protein [Devosia rhizoryzae]|uniref:DUF1176 domain-containing protein n=1 Tax=Devosia rhizoryzae TaxID=2774137 RepID=A0ABX7CA79_9HYPH|nr:DUF1176 domain-containing protein [Devosia rhizoryzae]QQR40592.1 DUF1176 domain-containing protein [Devosia rhizoryzae]
MIRPLLWLPLLALSIEPALAQASIEKQAQKLHKLAGGEWCQPEIAAGLDPENGAYQEWTLTYTPDYEGAETETMTLVRLFCMAGAYNVQHSYYLYREYEGLMPLAFAVPTFELEYENDDSFEGELLGIELNGMGAVTTLTNSTFDEETKTITSNAYWRGIGDASSIGVWEFREASFALKRYEVDATYDEEVNPQVLVDYDK